MNNITNICYNNKKVPIPVHQRAPYLLASIMPLERGLGLVSPMAGWCRGCSEATDLQVKTKGPGFSSAPATVRTHVPAQSPEQKFLPSSQCPSRNPMHWDDSICWLWGQNMSSVAAPQTFSKSGATWATFTQVGCAVGCTAQVLGSRLSLSALSALRCLLKSFLVLPLSATNWNDGGFLFSNC